MNVDVGAARGQRPAEPHLHGVQGPLWAPMSRLLCPTRTHTGAGMERSRNIFPAKWSFYQQMGQNPSLHGDGHAF